MHTQTKHPSKPVFNRARSLALVVRSLLDERDLKILQLTFEQRAIRFDHLAALVGISAREVARAVERLSSLTLLEHGRLQADRWAWTTSAGIAVASPSVVRVGRFSVTPPQSRELPHLAAVTETRLQYLSDHPDVEWISERMLRKEPGHRPDAVIRVLGELHAVEVELSRKDNRRVTATVRDLLKRYAAVHYCCSADTRHLLDCVQAENEWSRVLFIRDIGASS